MLAVQFLDKVLDMPVVVHRQVLRSMVQKTVVQQLPFIESRRLSLRAAEADPHGPDCSADHRDSPVAVRCQVVDDPIGDVHVKKIAEIPQLQSTKVVDIPFVTQRLIAMVLVTTEIPQLRMDKVVDAPIMQVVHTPVVCNDMSSTSLS